MLCDIYARGQRQPVRVLEAVWPITGLHTGPLAWFVYAGLGRARLVTAARQTGSRAQEARTLHLGDRLRRRLTLVSTLSTARSRGCSEVPFQ
jgi:hypothetical protein